MVRKGNGRKKVSRFRSVKKRNHFRSSYEETWVCNGYGERIKLVWSRSLKSIDARDLSWKCI